MQNRRDPATPRSAGASDLSIVVDARALHVSGLGRYLREILAALFADSRFGRITLLGYPDELRDHCASSVEPGRVRFYEYAHPFYSPRVPLAWLALRARGRVAADVAFFPHFDAPFVGLPRRSVVTVHDLTHLKVAEAYPAAKRFMAAAMIDRVASRAGRVVTDSDSTRRDLLARAPGLAGKLRVIPLGVDSAHWSAGPESGVPAGPSAAAPYLLCVGNRKRHKNLVAAVETLARLRPSWPELRLVIVGRSFAGGDGVRERALELGVAEAVEERSGVSDGELRTLYRECELLLFPSLYEGFGLPVLEAMASGAPVVASNRASIPELVADAGLLVDPDDYEALALAVRRIREEPGLRTALVARGRERARQFEWRKTGQRTLDLLTEVARMPHRVAGPVPHTGVHAER
jgi:glycosyltransferase involved in cell wall biosynthesis